SRQPQAISKRWWRSGGRLYPWPQGYERNGKQPVTDRVSPAGCASRLVLWVRSALRFCRDTFKRTRTTLELSFPRALSNPSFAPIFAAEIASFGFGTRDD